MAGSSTLKLAGYSLSLGMPLLAPLGVSLGVPWLSPLVVFGAFPILGLIVGEDRSLPIVGLRRSPSLLAYLEFLPRLYALVWMTMIAWAVMYVARTELSLAGLVGLTLSVGIASAVAL